MPIASTELKLIEESNWKGWCRSALHTTFKQKYELKYAGSSGILNYGLRYLLQDSAPSIATFYAGLEAGTQKAVDGVGR